jgi:hypothetical protein
LSALLLGCGEPVKAGLDEPLRVRDLGQFFEGELPGSPPLTSAQTAAGEVAALPTVTAVDGASGVLRHGDPERRLRGRLSPDAASVAVRFPALGSGYWVVPARTPDPAFQGELNFEMSVELSRALPPGIHELLFAAVDMDGHSGTQRSVGLCVLPPFPDNLNACDPKREPPNTIVSLEWDVEADLDLQVLTPDGVLVDAKNPSTDAEPARPSSDRGTLDHDAGAGCASDGLRRENLIFERLPGAGEYLVYANLFSPCRERAVRFTVSILNAEFGERADTFRVAETYRRSGVLLAAQANGGSRLGLFVTKFVVR